MFGQRAMKVENVVKLREEFDYKSLCRKLEIQVDVITMENERQSKVALDTKQEMEKKIKEMQWSLMEAEKNFATNLERELQAKRQRYEDELGAMSHSYRQEIMELRIKVEAEHIERKDLERELNSAKQTLQEKNEQVKVLEAETKRHQQGVTDIKESYQKEISEMVQKLVAVNAESQEMQEQMKAVQQTIKDHSRKNSYQQELEAETKRHQQELADMKERYQKKISEMVQKLDAEHAQSQALQEQIKVLEKTINDHVRKFSYQQELLAETKRHQQGLRDIKERHEKEILELVQKLNTERAQSQEMQEQMKRLQQTINNHNSETDARDQREILELRRKLEKHILYQESLEKELQMLRIEKEETSIFKANLYKEIEDTRHKVKEEKQHRCMLEDKVKTLKQQISQHSCEVNENRKSVDKQNSGKASTGSEGTITFLKSSQMRDTISGQRATIAKLFEEVGLQKILSLLESEDVDVRIHAVKVVANLAAEEVNQQNIVEAGGLTSLLMLLETSEDGTIQRVAAGAIANLAMNEKNQELIVKGGGIKLLARIANKGEDPQTLRMVAGAMANLCGNDKLQMRLRDEGGIKALLGMVRSRHVDVLAQVARGVANFAKCESRGATQAHRKGRSFLIDDGALPWIVANSNSEATPIKRHIELALCHLAQQEANTRDLVACGALWELVRISRECSREDIRNLCKRTFSTSSLFQMELKRMHLPQDDNTS